MIISVKEPKLEKVNRNLFQIVSISNEPLEDEEIFNMTELLPPADMLLKVTNGELSKKKFLKKYGEFIRTKDTNIEYTIFTIGMALEAGKNICLTASEKEYRLGYVKVLASYIGDLFNVEVKDLEEVNEEIKDELDTYSKKERKLLKKDDDELSKKETKFKKKLLKSVTKSISYGMDEEGKDIYNSMSRKFAIDQIVMVLIKNDIAKTDKKGGFKDINPDNMESAKPYIKAIFVACEESKKVRKTVKPVFESLGIKFKEKALKKLDKSELINLIGQIYTRILVLRSGVEE